jgi:hypothetical protein
MRLIASRRQRSDDEEFQAEVAIMPKEFTRTMLSATLRREMLTCPQLNPSQKIHPEISFGARLLCIAT